MISTKKNGLSIELMKQKHTFTGKIVSGAGKAAFFTRLDWVLEQCTAKLGFAPFPGTLNIEILPESVIRVETLQTGESIDRDENDDSKGDAEFIESVKKLNDFVPCSMTLASGLIYQGSGMITGETPTSSQSATMPISMKGPGEMTKQ